MSFGSENMQSTRGYDFLPLLGANLLILLQNFVVELLVQIRRFLKLRTNLLDNLY